MRHSLVDLIGTLGVVVLIGISLMLGRLIDWLERRGGEDPPDVPGS